MRSFLVLALAAPALAFLPPVPAPRVNSALYAAHVQAGGDYYPGKVDYGSETRDIIEVAQGTGRFNTLLKALEVTGLTNALKKESGIFTVFFPNDDAFAKLPAGKLDSLLANKGELTDLLKYHVVPLSVKDKESVRAFRLSNKSTLQGGRVKINVKANPAGGLQLVIFNSGEANGVECDIDACNGTIHELDGVLTPQAGTTIPLK